MKEFVLRVIHLLVYAFELLLHKTKEKVELEEKSADKDSKTEKGHEECQK